MSNRESAKDGGRRPRRPRLVLPFALVSLVLFVSLGVGIFQTVSRQLVHRAEETARLRAQVAADSIVGWETVFGQDYQSLLGYVRSQVLRWPVEHVEMWRADGTIIFSDDPRLMGRRFPLAGALREAFSGGKTVGEVDERDAEGLPGRGPSSDLYATYVPEWGVPQHAGKPNAVVEVYMDHPSIARQAGQLARTLLIVLPAGLAILWLLLLPLMYRLSRRLARQNAQLREAEEKGRALQAERARLLDRTVQATENERRSVALELHDGPVQHLAALDLMLENVGLALDPSGHSKPRTMLAKVQVRLREEVSALRRLMTELRPPALDERGLEAALRDHLNSVQAHSGVVCTVDSALTGRLDPAREIVLYRVAQEALANVAKHAGASQARVSLREVNSHVELMIRDDGRGFDPANLGEAAKEGHFGVIGMRERVEMAGGRWELQSSPGRGTTIWAALPTKEKAGDG